MEPLPTEEPINASEIAADTNETTDFSANTMNIAEEAHANPVPGEVRINMIRSRSFSDSHSQSPSTRSKQVLDATLNACRKLAFHFRWCIWANKCMILILSQLVLFFLWFFNAISSQRLIWLEPLILLVFALMLGYRWSIMNRRARETARAADIPVIRRSTQRRHGIRPRTNTSDLMRALIIQQIQINQARMILNSLNQDSIESEGLPFRARIMFAPRGQISSYLEDFVNSVDAFSQPSAGMTSEQIEAEMPKFEYSIDASLANEPETCTICLEDFQKGNEVRRAPCKHLFHQGCIDGWLSEKRNCPNCKFEINASNSIPSQENLLNFDIESDALDLV